jgi:predicted glycogen debranching enzyme
MGTRLSRERVGDRSLEWLETDGLGGFASGTPGGIRTRRYHGLLVAARTPPTGRVMLVNALEVWVDLGRGPIAVCAHHYGPDVVHPDGGRRLSSFVLDPVPTWTYELEDGLVLEQRFALRRGSPLAVVTWRLSRANKGAKLLVRPLLSVRDVHALARESADFRFDAEREGTRVRWRPRAELPAVVALATGAYRHEPLWYRNFLYAEERARGYDHVEDLGSPGSFTFDLGDGDAGLILAAEVAGQPPLRLPADVPPGILARDLLAREVERRQASPSRLDRMADDYVVARGSESGKTIVAGYPWFTDWGRDTFLALRGLCLARGRLEEAGSILASWARLVDRGMLPNRFVDAGDEPEFNSVDASLWFVVVAGEYLGAMADAKRRFRPGEREAIERAVSAILTGYAGGTRHGIHMADDGLVAAGEEGVQLTWMDAKVDGEVITPRIGKPVEIQALWINALEVGARLERGWRRVAEKARASFVERFWDEGTGSLHDVVDVDHLPGQVDASFRPNQILAIGGLSLVLLPLERARRVVDAVEARLLTPLGLRTLAPDDPRYAPVYRGSTSERDRSYHQGTAWPWLLGPFVEAWVRVRGSTSAAREEARARFLPPLYAHLCDAGLGHVSEIVDAEAPHTPRGAPFQAWSLGELLRLARVVLAPANDLALAGAESRGRNA